MLVCFVSGFVYKGILLSHKTMDESTQVAVAFMNVIGAILTLTGPIGVIVGLSLLFGVNSLILASAIQKRCKRASSAEPLE